LDKCECGCKSVTYYKKYEMKPFLDEMYYVIFHECGKLETKTEYLYYYSGNVKDKRIRHDIYINHDRQHIYDIVNSYRLQHNVILEDSMFNLFQTVLNDQKDKNIYQLACKFFQKSKL